MKSNFKEIYHQKNFIFSVILLIVGLWFMIEEILANLQYLPQNATDSFISNIYFFLPPIVSIVLLLSITLILVTLKNIRRRSDYLLFACILFCLYFFTSSKILPSKYELLATQKFNTQKAIEELMAFSMGSDTVDASRIQNMEYTKEQFGELAPLLLTVQENLLLINRLNENLITLTQAATSIDLYEAVTIDAVYDAQINRLKEIKDLNQNILNTKIQHGQKMKEIFNSLKQNKALIETKEAFDASFKESMQFSEEMFQIQSSLADALINRYQYLHSNHPNTIVFENNALKTKTKEADRILYENAQKISELVQKEADLNDRIAKFYTNFLPEENKTP